MDFLVRSNILDKFFKGVDFWVVFCKFIKGIKLDESVKEEMLNLYRIFDRLCGILFSITKNSYEREEIKRLKEEIKERIDALSIPKKH